MTPRPTSTGICADCTATDPGWALLNRGLLVCQECAGVHRSLGRHLSQLRSLRRGHWHADQLALVHALQAGGANNIWEHGLLTAAGASRVSKPSPADPVHPTKADFIRAKYALLSFVLRPPKGEGAGTLGDLNRQLWSCVRTGHVETTLRLLALGANPGHLDPDRGNSPLHVAAKEGQALQVELLVIYGADPGQPDAAGQLPWETAKAQGHPDLSARLRQLCFQTTDRLTMYLCGRQPDHTKGQDFVIPELASSGPESQQSTLARQAKTRMRGLGGSALEKLGADLYDEVERREVDGTWEASGTAPTADRFVVPFLPVNPDFTATRNQSRQKLAKFSARELASIIISLLSEVRRRHGGCPPPSQPHPASSSLSSKPHSVELLQSSNGSLAHHPARRAVKSDSSLRRPEEDEEEEDGESSGEDYDEVPDYAVVHKPPSPLPPTRQSASNLDMAARRKSSGSAKGRLTGEPSIPPTTVVTLEDFRGLQNQLEKSQSNVQTLTRKNEEISRRLDSLSEAVERLGDENSRLRASAPSQPQSKLPPPRFPLEVNGNSGSSQTLGSLGMLSRSGETEDVWQRREPLLTTATAFHSIARTPVVPRQSPSTHHQTGIAHHCAPAVVSSTEALTKQIQGLLEVARVGRVDSFASHAAGIQSTVDRIVTLVPDSLRQSSPALQDALNHMVDHCISLTVQCSKEPMPGRQEALSCQVVQAAFDVAKSAKQLMSQIQPES